MISFHEVVERSRRHNHDENVWVHPLSGRISTWFTWVFVNLGLSANQVTVVFWLCGLGAAGALTLDAPLAAFTAFVLFRLHVLFDVCDGEVARFNQTISRYGVYWDQAIHASTYPAILACLVWGRLDTGAPIEVALIGMAAMIAKSLDLAVKNLYYRVLWHAGPVEPADAAVQTPRPEPETPRVASLRSRLFGFASRFINFDSLLFLYAAAYLVSWEWRGFLARDGVLALYAVIFGAVAVMRLTSIPRRDGIPMRRDFYGG